jgi:Site-specific recombinase XerD
LTISKKRLARFSVDFGQRKIAGITVEELDNWLRALPGSPKSRANYRANVGVLFSYAERRRMIASNPILHTARPKLPDHPPEIFTVDELAPLLNAAFKRAPDMVPMLAIAAFAGIRDAEIKRLDWSEVDQKRGHIEIKSRKAKSARRRIVEMQPNLHDWLRPYAGMMGAVVPVNARKKLDAIRKAAGLARWPKNGLRHSFASYRLAATHDAPRVASELGHTSPHMLYSTYRELVLPEEAQRYWKIIPATGANNVIAWEAAAKMNTEGIPSCEWPDAKRPATFHNCWDKDGCPDLNLQRRAGSNRIQAITKQLDYPHGLTNKERRALANERQRLQRMFGLGRFSLVAERDDERKEKATEKKLRWIGKKVDQANLNEN